MTRRGFFGLFGAGATGVAMVANQAAPTSANRDREIAELIAMVETLRAELAKPKTIKIELDGRTVAESLVNHLKTQGLA